MNTFSRRAFLKGILSLAASAAVPVELIEKATLATEALFEIPSTQKTPAGYFKINDLLVPVTWMEISQPIGNITRFGEYGYALSPPELSEITFTTNIKVPYGSERVVFSISDKYLPFELTGNGYFSSYSATSVLVNSDESVEYTYSMSCEIDQWKSKERYEL